jgi:hypothetical protein
VIKGLLDLYEASSNVMWLDWANNLQEKQDEIFWDSQDSGYFSMAQDPNIVLRLKEGGQMFNYCIKFLWSGRPVLFKRDAEINMNGIIFRTRWC